MSSSVEVAIEQSQTLPKTVDLGPDASAAMDSYAMPATRGQVRFWSLDQLNPGNPALNMPLMWQCTGTLNVDAMVQTFALCVERHESLRTTFALVDGRLCQIIQPHMHVPIPVDDLTGMCGETQRLEADRITRLHAALRMNLSTGPLLDLRLLKLGAQHHVLLVTMHHIICDGISNGILMRDMIAFYEAIVRNEDPDLPELPIQFADYAVWHEEWCASPEYPAALEFWRKTLGNDFTPLRLLHDPDAPAHLPAHRAESTGSIETLLVPTQLTARAHAFCAREGITLNVLLFSIFCALLNRLTEQQDLTIGSPCANRTEDTEELIGLFMNIQVLRVRLEDHSTFRDLVGQVHAWTLSACENQSLPFEDLVHDAFFSAGKGALEIPVFFLYQKSFMLTRRIEGAEGELQIVPLRSESPGAIFELMFAIVDREEEGPRLQLEYNPQFFKPSTIQNYLRLFINLLDSAIFAPDRSIDRLDLLSAADRRALLALQSDTATDFGPFEPIHSIFLRRAAVEPGRVALTFNGADCTNAQLAALATALASRLLQAGVVPGDLVAICAGRSPEMLAAMLAVMMVGAAYLPLDPRHPQKRIQNILGGSGAAVLISDALPEFATDARIIVLHNEGPQAATPALPEISPQALAYVIFTSGSTGRPKGVAVQHGALMNLLRSMQREPGLTADDVLVAVTTLAFDISALELLLPLLTGARLVIATEDQVHDPARLLRLLDQSGATVLQATPGAWRALIDEGWDNTLPLKVLCGGETLSRDLADKLLDRSDDVWNMYGPTETTIWSSATRVTRELTPPRIGPPIANTQFYILNAHLQPVPQGITGELYIGGTGLARGYWNNDTLTAEKFIANPFGAGRIYGTGDLARWHSDGCVQLLGRADFQVKVRGYRIELGEIETALEAHPHVNEAVVVQHVVDDPLANAGVTRLVAFVAVGPRADAALAPDLVADLDEHLARTLPEYMLPNAIVALEQLPRNANGKIDRNALPDVFTQAGDAGLRINSEAPRGFLGPRDDLERQLTDLWQTTLGIPRISIRASFFSLGVGSLAALRLVTKMNRLYALDLGLASLISASSIESIADLIRNHFSSRSSAALVPLKPEGTEPPLFILHGVGGNVISFYGLAMRMQREVPVYGVQAQSLLPGQPAVLRLEDMAAWYIREIRAMQPQGPYHLLGYSFGGTVALEMARQLTAAGQRMGMLGMLDSRTLAFDRDRANELSVHEKLDRRVQRLQRNTNDLDWRSRLSYFAEKARTRAIRFTCKAAGALHIRSLPSFFKSAWDINLVAIENYVAKPFNGRLTLFRATQQEFPGGPRDLGWSSLFQQGVDIHEIEGDHERLFLEPNINTLAAILRKCMDEA